MTWTFAVDANGLVWPDPGDEMPQLKEALRDCAESLSPLRTRPALSTYWIDHLLNRCAERGEGRLPLTRGNWWVLWLDSDLVRIGDEEDEDLGESLPLVDLVAGLHEYRAVVQERIEEGHTLDQDRWWAQRNPFT